MGLTTGIEWCDSTLNLQMGCDGCELWIPKLGIKVCYSGVLHERYAGRSIGYPESFDKPKLFLYRIDETLRWPDLTGKDRPGKPWLNGLPRLIFLDDMGDTFTESLPLDWLAPHLPVLEDTPHIYILLTKRARRMRHFFSRHHVPRNFWLLASITSAASYPRLHDLIRIPGNPTIGISYEPAWGPVNFAAIPWRNGTFLDVLRGGLRMGGPEKSLELQPDMSRVSWVISGGASGLDARPAHPDWFRAVRQQCEDSGTAYFHKQNGMFIPFYDRDAEDPASRFVPDLKSKERFINIDGRNGFDGERLVAIREVGKAKAGCLLDGREHKEFPTPQLERVTA